MGSREIIVAAFEEAINCDGCVEKHEITLKSISRGYLEDWKKVLEDRFSITSKINNNHELTITHKENFEKISDIFSFVIEKSKKIKKMSTGKKSLHPNTALKHYKTLIEEFGPITIKELANITNTTTSNVKKITKVLYDVGLVNREKIDLRGTYIYSVI